MGWKDSVSVAPLACGPLRTSGENPSCATDELDARHIWTGSVVWLSPYPFALCLKRLISSSKMHFQDQKNPLS
jgi:hypothetical protein